MSDAHRAIPAPTAESRPFWDAAARGVLTLAKCEDCGRIAYPPRPRCPDCLSEALVWTELSGRARLRGWTDNHIARLPGRSAPVCIVECAVEEDTRAVIALIDEAGSVRGCAPDTALQITFRADPNGWSYPEARVAGEAR